MCGPPGADRTQVDPMLATWTLLSGNIWMSIWDTFEFTREIHCLRYFLYCDLEVHAVFVIFIHSVYVTWLLGSGLIVIFIKYLWQVYQQVYQTYGLSLTIFATEHWIFLFNLIHTQIKHCTILMPCGDIGLCQHCICSYKGLLLGLHQAVTLTSAGTLLIGPSQTWLSEIEAECNFFKENIVHNQNLLQPLNILPVLLWCNMDLFLTFQIKFQPNIKQSHSLHDPKIHSIVLISGQGRVYFSQSKSDIYLTCVIFTLYEVSYYYRTCYQDVPLQ